MKAFDRDLARGPWRLVPVPTFLADARAGLSFQIVWTAVLGAALLALFGVLSRRDPGIVRGVLRPEFLTMIVPSLLFGVAGAAAFARGGFDFSMGPIAVFAALIAIQEQRPELGVAAALGFGLAVALLVAIARLPGWLLTLGAAFVLRRAALEAFPGGPLAVEDRLPPWIPEASLALLALAAAALFAIGQLGPRPARGRGFGARLVDGLPYLLSAGLAGVAGVCMAQRTGGLSGAYFSWFWTDSLAAVLLGGTWFGSGRPNVPGTLAAVFLLRTLAWGLTWLGVDPFTQLLVVRVLVGAGLVLSIAVHALRAGAYARPRAQAAAAPGAPPPPPYVV